MANTILEMKGISKSFYGVKVLRDAKLSVQPGEVHVLLGENGAGKSTLIKILSGAYRRESGEIFLDGKPFYTTNPKDCIEAGISVIYQEFNLVPDLPIYENIFLGKEFVKNKLIDRKTAIKESRKYLDMLGMNIDPKTKIANLSVAQKQLVEIAKAISCNARILVLDEPTAAITDNETKMLFGIIRKLTAEGIGIIYISHRMSELFEIGNRCTVMRDGQYVDTVVLKETNELELTKMMVGREVSFERLPAHKIGETVLEVKDLCYRDKLKNINLKLHKGEILGLSGLIGAGRTELAKCIIGAYTMSSGEIIYKGNKLKPNIPDTIASGIVYLSEDRKDEGLVLGHSVQENIALPNLKQFGRFLLNKRKIAETAKDSVKKLRVRTHSINNAVQNLSGGNQQKVVIAKWLKTGADVYIFDEPTRGIDVGARDEIYNIMYDLITKGASIIMISSDLTEVMKMCDRIAVMKDGRITSEFENSDELTQEQLLACALIEKERND